MHIKSILKLVLLKLIGKGGSFSSNYTLHQIFIRLGSFTDLSDILSELVKEGLLQQTKNALSPSTYNLTEDGYIFLDGVRLENREFNKLEEAGLKNISFLRQLICPPSSSQ